MKQEAEKHRRSVRPYVKYYMESRLQETLKKASSPNNKSRSGRTPMMDKSLTVNNSVLTQVEGEAASRRTQFRGSQTSGLSSRSSRPSSLSPAHTVSSQRRFPNTHCSRRFTRRTLQESSVFPLISPITKAPLPLNISSGKNLEHPG